MAEGLFVARGTGSSCSRGELRGLARREAGPVRRLTIQWLQTAIDRREIRVRRSRALGNLAPQSNLIHLPR